MAYIDVSALSSYMGGITFSSADSTLLTNEIIPAMQALVDQFCQRTFEAATDTVRLLNAVTQVGYGDYAFDYPTDRHTAYTYASERQRRTLYLDKDLCEIAEIINGDGVVITSDQYTTEPLNETPYHAIVLKANANVYWTWEDDAEGAISIEGKWAYSETAPAQVRMACLRWAKFLYRQRDNDQTGIDQPMMTGDGVFIMPTSIPKDIVEYLEPLRRKM